MKNKLLDVLKETDPSFKKFLEEKITINRENFDRALIDVFDLGPDSPASVIIELSGISTKLWDLMRAYHV